MKSKPKSTFAILYFLGRPATQLERECFVYMPIRDSKAKPIGYIRVQLVRAVSIQEAFGLSRKRKDEVLLKAVFPGDIAAAEWAQYKAVVDKALNSERTVCKSPAFAAPYGAQITEGKVKKGGVNKAPTTPRPAGAPGAQRK